MMDIIAYPCWDLRKIHVSKSGPRTQPKGMVKYKYFIRGTFLSLKSIAWGGTGLLRQNGDITVVEF